MAAGAATRSVLAFAFSSPFAFSRKLQGRLLGAAAEYPPLPISASGKPGIRTPLLGVLVADGGFPGAVEWSGPLFLGDARASEGDRSLGASVVWLYTSAI